MGWTIFRAVDIDLIDQNHVFSFGHSMGPNPKTQVGSLTGQIQESANEHQTGL